MNKKRIEYIDVLKVIGLLCIILAHVELPKSLSLIRTFDVVLMVLISGYLGLLFYKNIGFLKYYLKRFNRLVLPTWIFLSLFFIMCLCMKNDLSIKSVFLSYALSNFGIGYVWIIRIYLLIALLVPLYNYIVKYFSKLKLLIISLVLMIIHEILCYLGVFDNNILNYLFAYVAPCLLLLCMSNYLFDLNSKKLLIISLISLLLCISIGYILYVKTGSFQSPQIHKYPFRTYYLTYGIAVSSVLICIIRNNRMAKLIYNKFIKFVSEHSLWIYLWHILAIFILKRFELPWFINYALIIIFAITITFVQSIIIEKLKKIFKKNHFLKVFEG